MIKVKKNKISGVISVSQFSKLTGLAPLTVKNYCDAGAIKATIIPNVKKTTYLINSDQVEKFKKDSLA